MSNSEDYEDLPGFELVGKGLEDLREGRDTKEALLVSIGAPRLRWLGIDLPREGLPEEPENQLFDRFEDEDPRTAHSSYNAWIRRLIRFERGVEHRVFSARRREHDAATGA